MCDLSFSLNVVFIRICILITTRNERHNYFSISKKRNKIQIHLRIVIYLKAKAREKHKAARNFNLIFLNLPK